jgi:deazaflavin-dependent oxidoreductase (nitroreductase family)
MGGGADTEARPLSRRERIALFLHRELDHRLTPLGVAVFRRTKGGIAKPWKVDALLLTTRGRRTGKERTVVLQWFRDRDGDGDGEAMVVVAANDGGERDPAWYRNLAAEPRARVEVAGRRIQVRAEILDPDAALAWWPRILERSPEYERYRRATDRPFPVVRLAPVG